MIVTYSPTTTDLEFAALNAHCGADGYSVHAAPIPARPSTLDKRFGLEPEIDRERHVRLPGTRLRGTTQDPLDNGAKPGRNADILFEGRSFAVTSNLTEEQRQKATDAMLRRHLADPGELLYEGPKGRLERRGRLHVMHRECKHCGKPFMRWRLFYQKRRWGWLCSESCRAEAKRTADRERMRARRAE